MSRQPAVDSIQGKIEAAKGACNPDEVLQGLKKLTKAERNRFDHRIAARVHWKATEIIDLHAIIKQETRVAKIEREAATTPRLTTRGLHGDLAPHPIHGELRAERQLLNTMLRMIGLDHKAGVKKDTGAPMSKRGKSAPVSMLR